MGSRDAELDELRTLLARTSHPPAGALGVQCGHQSTSGLRWMDDGQRESSVMLFNRRKAEDMRYSGSTGRPTWDPTPMRRVPSHLRGVRPRTPEPWATDPLANQEAQRLDRRPDHVWSIVKGMQTCRRDLKYNGKSASMLLVGSSAALSEEERALLAPPSTFRAAPPHSPPGRESSDHGASPPGMRSDPGAVMRSADAASSDTGDDTDSTHRARLRISRPRSAPPRVRTRAPAPKPGFAGGGSANTSVKIAPNDVRRTRPRELSPAAAALYASHQVSRGAGRY